MANLGNWATLRENPDMSRVGTRWTKEEEKKLMEMCKTVSITDMAKEFKRTSGGIKSHMLEIAMKLTQDGLTLEGAAETMGVTLDELEAHMAKKGKSSPVKSDNDDLIELKTLLLEIRDMLKTIVSNIEYEDE